MKSKRLEVKHLSDHINGKCWLSRSTSGHFVQPETKKQTPPTKARQTGRAFLIPQTEPRQFPPHKAGGRWADPAGASGDRSTEQD